MNGWSGLVAVLSCALVLTGCAEGASGETATVVVTETVTATVTEKVIETASPPAEPVPTVDEASLQAEELARQACQSFTDAYAVGPSSLYFPRAEALAAQAAGYDVKWATLSADVVSANRDHMENMYSDAGRRAQQEMEKAVADACTELGVKMVYANGDPIGQ